MTPPPGELALVMSGGGARAAYQVGLLRHLARHHPDLKIPILTGVSAGAINAAFLAAHTAPFADKIAELSKLWSRLTTNEVFRVDSLSIARNSLRLAARLISGGAVMSSGSQAFVDTAPLRATLERALGSAADALPGIETNLENRTLRAVAITTSSYSTGQSVTWVQSHGIPLWERAHRMSRECKLRVEHVLGSSALPIFFPAIEIEGQYYGDGGIRLTAPLSPAVHLGADRILAISTRYPRTRAEADRPVVVGYPPPAQVVGVLFNAIFLDLFDADALTMQLVNRLIEAIAPEQRQGLRPVQLLVLRPSRDLGQLANEYEAELPAAFRFMTRGLGTREMRSNDLLSLVMFQPDYLSRLIELGESDADRRADEIAEFLVPPAARV